MDLLLGSNRREEKLQREQKMEAKQNKKAELLFTVCCAGRFWVPLRKGDGGR